MVIFIPHKSSQAFGGFAKFLSLCLTTFHCIYPFAAMILINLSNFSYCCNNPIVNALCTYFRPDTSFGFWGKVLWPNYCRVENFGNVMSFIRSEHKRNVKLWCRSYKQSLGVMVWKIYENSVQNLYLSFLFFNALYNYQNFHSVYPELSVHIWWYIHFWFNN